MQGFKTLALLAVVVAILGLVSAAPAESDPAAFAGLEQAPAMLVRRGLGEPSARACTASACRSLCRSLGWNQGVCLDAVWCMCYN